MAQSAVFITGVAGGVGAALGAAYRQAGWRVIGSDLRTPDSPNCDVFVQADLDALAEDDRVAARVAADVRAGLDGAPLTALVNNAAIQILAGTARVSAQDWRRTMNVNLTAPFRLSQLFLPDLEASGGVILNIGSVHARSTKAGFAAYATSKAALHGLTRALAVDLGGRVRVVCLAPAAISTPMLMAGFTGRKEAFGMLEACHPAGRTGTPDEVAEAALFLTSRKAGFATGSTLWLDGGVLARLHDPL